MRSLSICMVSDFFYPSMGGVESHLYNNSQCLMQRGHKVVIVTHAYGQRRGVRYLAGGLKVYYIPAQIVYSNASLPTFFCTFPIFRQIFIREQVEIVHGHQAFSTFCHEAILHARSMGLKTVFTDHSLLGFGDASGIFINKLLKFTLSDVHHAICVSHTSKENTVLRAALEPQQVSVIPNAIIAEQFEPDGSARDPRWITVVVLSRLVYRKGVDLLVAAVPRICAQHARVRFVIGGDGPKRIDLEQMREQHQLQDRVELLGSVAASDVRHVLVRGDIFLNTSLTEAFCIAIVEAASCGLLVVSTRVGGIPEVLPRHMVTFAAPEEDAVVEALSATVELVGSCASHAELAPEHFHRQVKRMYSWHDVAERTERVYLKIADAREPPLIERFRRYYGCGLVAGKLFCLVAAVDFLIGVVLAWLWPSERIEPARAFDYARYRAEIGCDEDQAH
ncbi:Phosphatidylinositol N-acetylglucosaminyltransferase GPI3 subunit [Coemansia interrupta]|uniref:Phosphatidylinositol N-acetylglucosaminyltransferase GPI3 subunit n=1 Tax=Coemansia interrupta TaxID=1126814 RepID=A0A9W8HJ67_9FUNG|nr:Phosphatidylinositol N-acetylglucosaminyltransferase GPI3 subunit [Coemansia interrupta]